MALARAEGSGQRFYSLSAQIQHERKHYYEQLEATQTGTLDITPWLLVVSGGKPGRSLYQNTALLLHLAQLAAQAHQLFTLGRAQAFLARQCCATIACVLHHPVGDGLRGDVELTRELGRRAPGVGELQDLLSKCRRIWQTGSGHCGLL